MKRSFLEFVAEKENNSLVQFFIENDIDIDAFCDSVKFVVSKLKPSQTITENMWGNIMNGVQAARGALGQASQELKTTAAPMMGRVMDAAKQGWNIGKVSQVGNKLQTLAQELVAMGQDPNFIKQHIDPLSKAVMQIRSQGLPNVGNPPGAPVNQTIATPVPVNSPNTQQPINPMLQNTVTTT